MSPSPETADPRSFPGRDPEAVRGLAGPSTGAQQEWLTPTAGALREGRRVCAPRLQAPAEAPDRLPDPELNANARTVLERRYLLRDADGQLAETPRQLFWRVAVAIAAAELEFPGGEPAAALALAEDFYRAMAQRQFLPNSPTLRNAGTSNPMLSACFVLPIEDSIDSIYDTLKAAALIHKSGGGTGFDFSSLRPRGDYLRQSAGQTEGPLRFLSVYSEATRAIQQGAFREGANMAILRIDHPDIVEFVRAKSDTSRLPNFNLSVAVTDRFLERLRVAPNEPHRVVHPRSGVESELPRAGGGTWSVAELWAEICTSAHRTGEPGLFFVDRVNRADPLQHLGPIRATNPCGEQPLHPWDSCNLGSINLARLVRGSGRAVDFDWDEFKRLARLGTRFLDNAIEANQLPLPSLTEMSRKTRRIGLGVMGFADTLFQLSLPYDCEEACAFGEQVMRVLDEEARRTSSELAGMRGNFGAYEGSKFERDGRPMRNSYVTTVAPTGTLSILADCSGGIEPVFALAYRRQVMRDQEGVLTPLVEVNAAFERAAREGGFWTDGLVERLMVAGTLAGMPDIPRAIREVFVSSRDIAPAWHLRMQAAFQSHCDAAISKTINFPAEASVEAVRRLYDLAIGSNVRGLTCYRDSSRDQQPMALAHAAIHSPAAARVEGPRPMALPEIMPSLRVRQATPFGNMHVKISVDPKTGREREVFAQLGKGGDLANSDLEAICRLLSLWLRSGGQIELALEQLEGIGSSLSIPTARGRVLSLADGLAQAISRYLEAKRKHGLQALLLGQVPAEELGAKACSGAGARSSAAPSRYELHCPECGQALHSAEGCSTCASCGWSQC